jgi:NitT/TauT family transport system permease protein
MGRRAALIAARLALIAAVLLIWEYVPRIPGIARWAPIFDPFFISSPGKIAAKFWELATTSGDQGVVLKSGNLFVQLWATLWATLLGFVVGVSTGFVAGLVLSQTRTLADIVHPYLVAVNALPRIALVPLIIMIFGTGLGAKVMLAWLIVFFIVFFNTYAGGRAIEPAVLDACRILGATRRQLLRTVVIPHVAGWTFAILPLAMSASIIGVVVGEFVGGAQGLGYIITVALGQLEATDLFVALLTLCLVAVALIGLAARLERRLLHWRPEHMGHEGQA